jgi:hypothetical protein
MGFDVICNTLVLFLAINIMVLDNNGRRKVIARFFFTVKKLSNLTYSSLVLIRAITALGLFMLDFVLVTVIIPYRWVIVHLR